MMSPAWLGLMTTDATLPDMYWKMWLWKDGVVAYDVKIVYSMLYDKRFYKTKFSYDYACAHIVPQKPYHVIAADCFLVFKLHRYLCEVETKGSENSEESRAAPVPPDLSLKVDTLWSAYPVTKCPLGHVTLSFLSCELVNDCGLEQHQISCTTIYRYKTDATERVKMNRDYLPGNGSKRVSANTTRFGIVAAEEDVALKSSSAVTVSMFVCADGESTLPYSLVCDFVPHCNDGSDETFCNHGDGCPELTCSSGQCFNFSQKCDKYHDCLDRSDEESNYCPRTWPFFSTRRLQPPTVTIFDGQGSFTQRPMLESDPCPETHFRCTRMQSNCLPVYVRCNGVSDCPGFEDEEDCGHYTCPGFYRCRESRVCVHADHMCDGWPQCPQRDDELYCGLTCPLGCLCQGMAFVCSVAFPAHEYLQTRYLDASRSKLKPADLNNNTYFVWLSLASCGIGNISHLNWPNLLHLDLGYNHLHVVSMDKFLTLPNLKTLILAGNPVVSLLTSPTCFKHDRLQHVDLSKTMLQVFSSKALSCYTYITELNISHCPVEEIAEDGFIYTPHLISLDLSGSPISNFPNNILKGLGQLKQLFSANHKLCCDAMLPEIFDINFCFAPREEISSCEDLLKSTLFRGCLWMFAVLGVVGNFGCILIRVFSKDRELHSGFNVFVTNLNVSDLLMGVCLAIVGVADEVYRGQYIWYDKTWENSTACTIAGYLAFLSRETSTFSISLVTLDRFIAITFPSTKVRFNGWSAALSCVVIWIVGVLVASVPLFPKTTRWEFYGQTGICIPFPISTGDFPGYNHVFGVMILLNFVLCILIAAGQISIHWTRRINSRLPNDSRNSDDLIIAKRVFKVVVSGVLCLFFIGLLGILSFSNVPVSSEVRVIIAIIVVPVNSALNPFLYTFSLVMVRRRKAYETQLINMLETRILSQKPVTSQ